MHVSIDSRGKLRGCAPSDGNVLSRGCVTKSAPFESYNESTQCERIDDELYSNGTEREYKHLPTELPSHGSIERVLTAIYDTLPRRFDSQQLIPYLSILLRNYFHDYDSVPRFGEDSQTPN